ncbi:MAG: hypothetical protein JWP61_1566 [Friedmanniella sp.]|jgi:hypothetical protein|nr:hypothetical protein [Friedmanniella sp.]
MDDRDRDQAGRAVNARPRDRLGRPLPHGSAGYPRVPEDLVLPPLPALREAQSLLDQGLPFHAHEVLEASWKTCAPEERELWQGLAQLAVGLTHLRRGNLPGAATLIRRARQRLCGYADDPPYGIALAGLLDWADLVLGRVSGPSPDVDSVAPPRLQVPPPAVEGGEAVCWLGRVCPECGGLDEHAGPRCPRCGADLPV